jgi:hypothetical protein
MRPQIERLFGENDDIYEITETPPVRLRRSFPIGVPAPHELKPHHQKALFELKVSLHRVGLDWQANDDLVRRALLDQFGTP